IAALGLLAAAALFEGIHVAGFWIAVVVAIILGLLNVFVKPILNILALPINLITFGLFSFIIGAFLFWFTGEIITGFEVAGFLAALVGSLFVTAVNMLGENFIDVLAD
ncbi:MAG: phage holin family protein, partial [Candidatus Paceibacterota bacterium]